MTTPRDVDWAYMAGFLDADGWITFTRRGILKYRVATVGFVQADEGISALNRMAHKKWRLAQIDTIIGNEAVASAPQEPQT